MVPLAWLHCLSHIHQRKPTHTNFGGISGHFLWLYNHLQRNETCVREIKNTYIYLYISHAKRQHFMIGVRVDQRFSAVCL